MDTAYSELDLSDNSNLDKTSLNFFLNTDIKILKLRNISLDYWIFDKKPILNSIVYLDVSFNDLRSILFDINYKNLKYLDVSFNVIEKFSFNFKNSRNFANLFNLEFFNLNNSITDELSDFQFNFQSNLQIAIVTGNNLNVFPKFCQYYQVGATRIECGLKELYFDFNRLKRIYSFYLADLVQLKYLNLDSNQISLIEEGSFDGLDRLETLILSHNKLDLAFNASSLFNSLSSLRHLSLSSNKIQVLESNLFLNLLKLELVDLSRNQIYLVKEKSFNGLTNLRELYLNDNFHEIEIENSSFVGFQSIQSVYVNRSILDFKFNKNVFIDLVRNKNENNNKTILSRIYYKAFNLISLNDYDYDCDLVYELIRFNIQFNLKTEIDFSNFLINC